jgi:hypothetical protein
MTFWGVRARGRYWGQSGHELLRRTRPLMTQSGHDPSRCQDTSRRDPLALGPTNVGGMDWVASSSCRHSGLARYFWETFPPTERE